MKKKLAKSKLKKISRVSVSDEELEDKKVYNLTDKNQDEDSMGNVWWFMTLICILHINWTNGSILFEKRT